MNTVAVGASGVFFDNATASGTSSGNFVDLQNVSGGAFRVAGTSAAGVTGTGIRVNNSSAAFTFNSITLGQSSTPGPMTYGIDLDGNSGSFTTTASNIIYYAQTAGIRITNAQASFVADFQGQMEVSNRDNVAYTAGGDGLVLLNNNAASQTTFSRFVHTDFQRNTGGGTVTASGQGIDADNGGSLTILDGAVSSNNALGDGVAAIDIRGTATNITLSSVALDNDDSGESGGGIYLENNTGSFTIQSASAFSTRNTTAIFANNAGTVSLGTVSAINIISFGASTGAIDITNTALNLTLGTVSAPTSAGQGIRLNNVSGTVTTGNLNLSNTGGTGATIDISNLQAGTSVTFAGTSATVNGGTNTAVSLTNNTGSTIAFTNGGLDIDTTSGAGYVATGGGTVTVTGTGNSVTTTTGRAVQIDGTSIGGAGVTFQSISSNGASNAINLRNTGSSGFFLITGTGSTDGSGGLIQNIGGADMPDETPTASGQGTAIYLENVTNFRADNLQVQNTSNFGLRGFGVNGITMTNVDFTGVHGNNAGADEGVFYVNNLTGTATFTGGTYLGGIEDSVHIDNDGTTGTLTLAMSGMAITTGDGSNAAIGNNGITIQASAGNVNGTISGNNFVAAVSSHLQLVSSGTANYGLTIDNNTFTRHSGIAGNGGIGILAGTQSSGLFNVTISNNNMATLGSLNNAIDVGSVNGAGNFAGTVDMTISGNTIGTNGVNGSGTAFSAINVDGDGDGSSIYRITGNQIFDHNERGIWVRAGEGAGSSHQMSVLIDNNLVQDTVTGFEFDGIIVDSGVSSGPTPTICATVTNNTVTGTHYAGHGIRVRARNNGSLQIANGTGGAATEVAVETHLAGAANNTVAQTIDAALSGTGTLSFVAACPN